MTTLACSWVSLSVVFRPAAPVLESEARTPTYNPEPLNRSLAAAARFGALIGTLIVAAGNEAGPTVRAGALPQTTPGLGSLAKEIAHYRPPELSAVAT